MSNLQKHQPSEIQIHTKHGVLRYEAPQNLSPEKSAVLNAYLAPKIAAVSDVQLESFLLRQINQALLLLGHSKQLSTPEEQATMSDAITALIRDKYNFLTLEEIGLIFQLGTRGEFKNNPEDVVMINLEKVNSWIKTYHRKTRAEVVASLKPVEPGKQKPDDYNSETDFDLLVQKVKAGQPVPETEWICQTAQHYERLNKSNAFNLSTKQRQDIYKEERQKKHEEGKAQMLHVSTETRFLFRAFMDGQTGNNQYEKEVIANCKIRVFRQYVETLAKNAAA